MNYVIVGSFVLTLGAVLIGVVLWLASGGAFQKKYDLYLAIEEESVAGLNLNAPVKYNGVEIGKVRDIWLEPSNPERVNVLLAIERGTLIKVDTVAVLKTQGLTGIAYVELSGSTQYASPLRATVKGKYPVIRTIPSLGTRLENVLTSVLGKLDSTSNNINAILSEKNVTAFENALADISTVAHTIAGTKDALDAGIASAARTFDNTARASEKLDSALEQIDRGAQAIEKMGNEVTLTSESTGNTVNEIGADMKRFTSETLPELEQFLGELSLLSNSLRRFSEQTQRDPAGLLFGRRPMSEGPGETSTGQEKQ